jgi:hypothetical protein
MKLRGVLLSDLLDLFLIFMTHSSSCGILQNGVSLFELHEVLKTQMGYVIKKYTINNVLLKKMIELHFSSKKKY